MSSRKESIDNRMFQKLARNNVKKNTKNYMIYFLTLTFSVAMLYTFNSIGAQFSMTNIPDTGSYLSFSIGMMAGISVFISIIMGFLVVYANKFLMRQRKKELGIYITLGMRREDLSRLLFRETVIIGFLSLAAGLVLGIILSQGLAFITLRFLQLDGSSYHFILSPGALAECIIFYSLMFVCINSFNKRSLKKSSLLDLLRAEQKNESEPEHRFSKNLVTFLASIVCFILAYVISTTDLINIKYVAVGIVLTFCGTFLFFRSIASILLHWMHKRRKLYYNNLNMFSIHQVSSKMNSTNTVLAVICLLLFLSFTTLSVGLGMSMSVRAGFDKMTSADIVIKDSPAWYDTNQYESIRTKLSDEGFPLEELTSSAVEAVLYKQKEIKLEQFVPENISIRKEVKKDSYQSINSHPNLMRISDFNQIREQQGLKPIKLSENQFLLNYNVIQFDKIYKAYAEQKNTAIKLGGRKLKLAPSGLQQVAYQNANVLADSGTIIVPDDLTEGRTVDIAFLNCKLNPDAETSFTEKFSSLNSYNMMWDQKEEIITEITSTNMTLSYMAVYMGIIFLICACAVLALHQITNTVDSVKRYETLRRLGADEKHVKNSLLMQLAIYFGIPLIVGLIHSIVAITIMYQGMMNVTPVQIMQNILFASVLLLAVYGAYFFITYASTRNTLHFNK